MHMIKGLNDANIMLDSLLFIYLVSRLFSNILYQSVSVMDENSTFVACCVLVSFVTGQRCF